MEKKSLLHDKKNLKSRLEGLIMYSRLSTVEIDGQGPSTQDLIYTKSMQCMCAGRLFHDRVWSRFIFLRRFVNVLLHFHCSLPAITSQSILPFFFQQRATMSIEIAAFALSMWVLPVAVACHGGSSTKNNKERKTLLSMASKIKLEDDETYNDDRAKQYNDESIEVTIDQSTAWSSYNCSLVCY